MLAKFGVALSFGINYLSNPYLFPTLFAATALGFCNTFARLFSALSPMLAQMDEPIPMILFVASSTLTLVAVFMLKVPKYSPNELITLPTASQCLLAKNNYEPPQEPSLSKD